MLYKDNGSLYRRKHGLSKENTATAKLLLGICIGISCCSKHFNKLLLVLHTI